MEEEVINFSLQESINDLSVLRSELLKSTQVYFSELSSLHDIHKNPKALFSLFDVEQDGGGNDIHPLNILNLLIILAIGLQDLLEFVKDMKLLEGRVLRLGSFKIFLNLSFNGLRKRPLFEEIVDKRVGSFGPFDPSGCPFARGFTLTKISR